MYLPEHLARGTVEPGASHGTDQLAHPALESRWRQPTSQAAMRLRTAAKAGSLSSTGVFEATAMHKPGPDQGSLSSAMGLTTILSTIWACPPKSATVQNPYLQGKSDVRGRARTRCRFWGSRGREFKSRQPDNNTGGEQPTSRILGAASMDVSRLMVDVVTRAWGDADH